MWRRWARSTPCPRTRSASRSAATPTAAWYSRPSTPAGAALTEEQREFAAKNHDLIYAFLHRQGWDVGEYYDIAALGFLSAVRRYLTAPGQLAFSTLAWGAMRGSIASFRRTEQNRKEAERRYLAIRPAPKDPIAELEARLIFHDLVSNSSPEQYRLASLRLQGYSIAETARLQGISERRVSKLLREMYRVYLKLYMN